MSGFLLQNFTKVGPRKEFLMHEGYIPHTHKDRMKGKRKNQFVSSVHVALAISPFAAASKMTLT